MNNLAIKLEEWYIDENINYEKTAEIIPFPISKPELVQPSMICCRAESKAWDFTKEWL